MPYVLVRYYTGDLVNVTCYSKGSSPPAELAWKVNDDQVRQTVEILLVIFQSSASHNPLSLYAFL